MKLIPVVACILSLLLISSPAISSGPVQNQQIQKKLEKTKEFQRRQSKKLEEMLKKLHDQFKTRRSIPEGVRLPEKRQYRFYKK